MIKNMIEEKLNLLGIVLQTPSKTAGSYLPVVKTRNLVFVSGQLPIEISSKTLEVKFKGKVGKDLSISDGKESKTLPINALAHLKDALLNLDHIKKFVKLSGSSIAMLLLLTILKLSMVHQIFLNRFSVKKGDIAGWLLK